MDNPKQKTVDQVMQMINLRRHDWLNHIQVLLGQHSMQKYDDIRVYLNQLVDQLQNENHIARLGNSQFVFDLFSYAVRYPDIQFDVEIPEIIHLKDYGITDQTMHLMSSYLDLYGEYLSFGYEETPSLLLSMGKLDDKIQITVDFVGRLHWEQLEETWIQLKGNLQAQGVHLTEKVRSENEWVVDIIMG